VTLAGRGLDDAVRLIKSPIHATRPIEDVILSGIADPWQNHAYKLQILRQRMGHAWEMVLTDYGFKRSPVGGIDLINPVRRIAMELKNSCRVSSSIKRDIFHILADFKRRRPRYQVIFGCINYRNMKEGGTSILRGVHYVKGQSLLTKFLGRQKVPTVNRLKAAVRYVMRHNA